MYFVGVDIGKTVNMACRLGKTAHFLEFKNTKKGIDTFKKWLPHSQHIRILVEATGGYHYPLVWNILRNGYEVRIINPILARRKKIVSLRTAKTDSIDAQGLAELARDNKGTAWIPLPHHMQHRLLARTYFDVNQHLTREKVRLQQMKLLWRQTESSIPEWLNENLINFLKGSKEKLGKLLEQYDIGLLERLATIPGVSQRLASIIIAETGSFERFSSVKSFIAYTGLDPSIRQSGGKPQAYGKLSKRGSPILRTALYLSAMGGWRAPFFRPIYDIHRAKQRSFKEILAIIARKIARTVYALAKTPNSIFLQNYPLHLHT